MFRNASARQFASVFFVLTCGLLACRTAARAATVTGHVLGPDGHPVSHAKVYLQAFYTKAAPALLETDAAGKFVFDAVAPPGYGSVARAVVVAPGLALGGAVLKTGDNTIQLTAAGQVAGQVTDANGQPVAGAQLHLRGVEPDPDNDPTFDNYVSTLEIDGLEARFSTTTDAAGRWTLTGVPREGKADVDLNDPAYVWVRQRIVLGPGTPTASPLVARPGANLTGRIVYEDGKSAAGVKIFAQGQASVPGWSRGVSGADGAYRLSSLVTGTYNVMADEDQKLKDVVAHALEGVTAQEGKTVPLPDLVLGRGALIEGTVTDAVTGAPLGYQYVGSYGPHRPRSSAVLSSTRTDARGHYQIRVPPGKSYIYLQGVPPGYLRPDSHNGGEDGADVVLETGQTKTIPFRLKQGLTVAGMAVDGDGKPVRGVKIMLGQAWETVPASTDATGKWTVIGLKPGEVHVSTDDTWQVVTPEKVTLPVAGLTQVTLRRRKLQSVTARVVDTAGQPLAGATARADIDTPVGDGGYTVRTKQALTDAEGKIGLTSLRPDDLVTLHITKPGYKYLSGGAATYQTTSWKVSDTVLVPLIARLTGIVKDAGGKPIPGAQVFSPDGGATTFVSATANGQFTLRDLPAGEVTVMAANGIAFAQGHATSGAAPVALSLLPVSPPPSGDTARARAIIEDVLRESKGTSYYARTALPVTLAPGDPDAALALSKQLDATDLDRQLAGLIFLLAELDPVRARQWTPPQLARIQAPDQGITAATALALATIGTEPDLARQMLAQCKIWSQQLVPLPRATDVWQMFPRVQLAALAGRLQDPDAGKMLGQVMVAVLKSSTDKTKPTQEEALGMVAEVVAQGSPALVEQVLDQMGPAGQSEALSRAIPEIARYDVPAALRLLDRLEKINVAAGEPSAHGGLASRNPEWSFGLAAKPVVAALAKTDPAAALALARRVKKADHKPMALALAARAQPPQVRSQLFHEAIAASTGYRGASIKSQIAAMAYEVDRPLGMVMFKELKQGSATPVPNGDDSASIPAFAFYYARVEPGISRLMLESEYLRLQQTGAGQAWKFGAAILGMAAIDPDRALAMARAIPLTDANARFDLQRKIAQYLAAPDAVRATMSFARWNASDTWTPGTETHW